MDRFWNHGDGLEIAHICCAALRFRLSKEMDRASERRFAAWLSLRADPIFPGWQIWGNIMQRCTRFFMANIVFIISRLRWNLLRKCAERGLTLGGGWRDGEEKTGRLKFCAIPGAGKLAVVVSQVLNCKDLGHPLWWWNQLP